MRTLLLSALIAIALCGCTTTSSDVVLLKTVVGPAHCSAPANGACASCETACPALKQALCVGGSSVLATDTAAASCVKPPSCACQ
ncbi:hypothetical protein QTI24_12170 [Variovorax sp. J22P240]|uniref:hypothetical protein n=1 Tax=unclassified Variovorax TaxID=663243 RepID=UPI00257794FA|nr:MULTISPECIES: hypothetical protein [unclassified Variovorax]MDL9999365.1 hypothetical protein [Variovorax sp. J22P240]MDM0052518.1 hypothetical protein [Variovorax sp. J22R115]